MSDESTIDGQVNERAEGFNAPLHPDVSADISRILSSWSKADDHQTNNYF